jgi:putative hydrolase of the HAD superfamily
MSPMTTEKVEAQEQRFSAVIFDLFITLTDFEAERRRPDMMLEIGETLGLDGPAFVSIMRETFTERATGLLGDLPSTLRQLSRRLGSDPSASRLDAAVRLRLRHEMAVLRPREGVLETLAGLKADGLLLGIVTDCSTELPPLWPQLPYAELVDGAVFSCQMGHRKPHRSLYEEAVRLLAVRPEQCLYVGDGGSKELTGAQAVGMTAVLLETPFSDLYRYDAERDWNGGSIRDLNEIPMLLSGRS